MFSSIGSVKYSVCVLHHHSHIVLGNKQGIYKGHRNQGVNTTIFDIINIGTSRGWEIDVFRLCFHPNVDDETGNHGRLNKPLSAPE